MKQLTITCCLLLAAGVLSAAEAKKPETKKTEPASTAASAPAPAPVVTTPPSPTDSPLVAAAKKSKRGKAKPANVITNDTLSKSGGHITQAEKLPDLPPPPPPPKPKPVDPMAAEYARRAEAVKKQEADKKAKADARKKSDAERATAATYDETLDERFDDPAAAEHAMQENPANQPPATQTQKPPM